MKTNSITFIFGQHHKEFLINDIFYNEEDALNHLKKTTTINKYEEMINQGVLCTIHVEDRVFNKIKKQGHFFVSFNETLNKFGYPTPILIRGSKISLINDYKKIVDNTATEKSLFQTVKNTALCWTIQIR